MPEHFTIVGKTKDYRCCYNAVLSVARGTLEVHGDPDLWEWIKVTEPSGVIKFTSLEYTGPMDEFSRLSLGMATKFRGVSTQARVARERVVKVVQQCNLFIGVVGDPNCSIEDQHDAAVFAVAECLAGMVFDGNAMLDAEGRTILTLDGETDSLTEAID